MFSLSDVLETPVAFQFKVIFTATAGLTDTSFQDISGLDVSMEGEKITEGGENRFEHFLPTPAKHPNLVLTRAIAPLTSPLVIWCKSILEGDLSTPIVAMPMQILLTDKNGLPVRIWSISHAMPVAWKVGALNSTKNEVAIETIELAYNYATRML
jgi:phage tail-like protein